MVLGVWVVFHRVVQVIRFLDQLLHEFKSKDVGYHAVPISEHLISFLKRKFWCHVPHYKG